VFGTGATFQPKATRLPSGSGSESWSYPTGAYGTRSAVAGAPGLAPGAPAAPAAGASKPAVPSADALRNRRRPSECVMKFFLWAGNPDAASAENSRRFSPS